MPVRFISPHEAMAGRGAFWTCLKDWATLLADEALPTSLRNMAAIFATFRVFSARGERDLNHCACSVGEGVNKTRPLTLQKSAIL